MIEVMLTGREWGRGQGKVSLKGTGGLFLRLGRVCREKGQMQENRKR